MKKMSLILLIVCVASGVVGAPRIPFVTPTVLWLTPQATPAPAIVSPTPTPTAAPAATAAPLINGFNPYDGSVAPSIGIYQVAALYGPYLATYTYKKKPDAYFPAFFFPLQNTSKKGFKLDFDYCPDNLINPLLKKLDSTQAYLYLNAYTDGENFSAGFRSAIAPLNTVNVIKVSFKKPADGVAQWWGQIQTLPCNSSLSIIDPTTLPSYLLQHQSDVTHNGALEAGLNLMGFDAILPLVSAHTVWVPFTQLEVSSARIVYKVAGTRGHNLNLRSGAGKSFTIIDKMPEYSTITSLGFPANGWVQVTDQNGISGWCSTAYLMEQ